MPDPAGYTDKDEFMEACIPKVMEEGKDQDQAVAQCNGMWESRQSAKRSGIWQEMSGDESIIYAYGPIGYEVTPELFAKELQAAKGKSLKVYISSYGGDALAGLTMYNDMRELAESGKHITTVNRGYAVSAASLMFVAGDEREMARGSKLMIHEPMQLATASTLKDVAESLESSTEEYAKIYSEHSRLSVEDVRAAMAKETWYDPVKAVKAGLATNAQAKIAAEYLPTRRALEQLGCQHIPKECPEKQPPVNRLHRMSQYWRLKQC